MPTSLTAEVIDSTAARVVPTYYRVYENPAIYELDPKGQEPNGAVVLIDNRPSASPTVTVPAQFT